MLQGYLYITKNYIAFYSNVFGYVTKLLIPVTSVTRVSKEKTVKIIPNAIAVATVDERHVFSSFLSREAAYQLIISVWREALPLNEIDVTSTAAQLRICIREKHSANSSDAVSESKLSEASSVLENVPESPTSTLQVMHQLRRQSNSGISEIEDESSSAISGSEGLARLLQSKKPILGIESGLNDQIIENNSSYSSNSNSNSNHSNCDLLVGRESNLDRDGINEIKSLTSTPKIDGSVDKLPSVFGETSSISIFKLRIPRTIHIAYFGLSLVIILVLVAVFLFYRISEMKNSRFVKTFSIDELTSVNKTIYNTEFYFGCNI